jgi:hypothetical protein
MRSNHDGSHIRGIDRPTGNKVQKGARSAVWRGGQRSMKHKSRSPKQRKQPKTRLRLPDLEFSKAAVLSSLSSADGPRGYGHAIDEFVDWYCSEPRLAAMKPTGSGSAGIARMPADVLSELPGIELNCWCGLEDRGGTDQGSFNFYPAFGLSALLWSGHSKRSAREHRRLGADG